MPRKIGRPTVMTQETIDKIEYVFAMGGTDKEACLFADISHQTLYDFQDKFPEFIERKEALKQNPMLKARTTIVAALDKDVNTARWYAERRDPDFKQKSETDITSKGEKMESSTSNILEIAARVAEELKVLKT
jgi:hypothetical protein